MKITAAPMIDAAEAACETLKALANPHRLIILCQLVEGERSVGQLADFLGIRDSTVSQNLALMRKSGIVAARRDGQTMWYSIQSPDVQTILATLYKLYCAPGPICASPSASRSTKRRKP